MCTETASTVKFVLNLTRLNVKKPKQDDTIVKVGDFELTADGARDAYIAGMYDKYSLKILPEHCTTVSFVVNGSDAVWIFNKRVDNVDVPYCVYVQAKKI